MMIPQYWCCCTDTVSFTLQARLLFFALDFSLHFFLMEMKDAFFMSCNLQVAMRLFRLQVVTIKRLGLSHCIDIPDFNKYQ
jgi:hypothetical protein